MTSTTRLPKPVSESWDWQMDGLCRGQNSAVFFHPDNERGSARSARESRAKEICNHCPVLAQCRSHALEAQEPYGVWGGMGEDERRRLIASSRRRLRTVTTMQ
ncbi:WhiB family transcriptional regulator [Umezawaea beigongshangensis]|uniref:WhiB family transcriptional regulator n=1 Tax=Umezawaea beigongshangensis TaxID=2780383 RepID=UPI0018F11FCB|nr:WhiB family transcriptional regulator [Umezawaea beigongshangensis]